MSEAQYPLRSEKALVLSRTRAFSLKAANTQTQTQKYGVDNPHEQP